MSNLDRRTLLKTAAAAAAMKGSAAGASKSTQQNSSPLIVVNESGSVVETTAGKVRGYTRNGIHTFKGIPYAASTAGAARFMPPEKPKAWTGIRSSLYYGQVCP